MIINRSAITAILFAILFIGCTTAGRVKGDKVSFPDSEALKTVSVSAFTCPDPLIARDVQNAIIGSLLESHSVTTGGEAGIVISGNIILSNDDVLSKGGSASSLSASGGKISEIKANVFKNGKIIDSVSVTGSETVSDSPEEMGRKIGVKIKEILSR